MSGKLAGFVRGNAIALVALFIALGGTSYAATVLPANSVGTKQIKAGAVTAAKLKAGAVTAAKIKAGAVGTRTVATNAITGEKILESSLGQVPSAATADHASVADRATASDDATTAGHAATADLADNSTRFGGVDSSVLGTSVIVLGHWFRPLDSTIPWSNYSGGGITSTSANWFIAQVGLPQGAQVTNIIQYYHTSSGASTGELSLVRCPLNDYGTVLVTMTATPGVGGYGSRSATPSASLVIDNTTYAYALQWNSPGSSGALMGVELEYTLR